MSTFFILAILVIGVWGAYKVLSGKSAGGDGAIAGLPAGFSPSHSHDNIALEASSKRLWARDEKGNEKLFDGSEITGWAVNSDTTSNRVGATWPHNVYLELKTKDIDRPVWRIRFKRYGELTPEKRNLEECREWFERLNAVYNH